MSTKSATAAQSTTPQSNVTCAACKQAFELDKNSERCPHCALPVALTLGHDANIAVDANGHIRSNTPCNQCGYSLRGLPVAHDCPECGTPVSHASRHPLLCRSDPQYLKTLTHATTITMLGLYGIAAGIIMWILMFPAMILTSLATPALDFLFDVIVVPIMMISMIVIGLSVLLLVAGAVFFAKPDPAALMAHVRTAGTRPRALVIAATLGLLALAPVPDVTGGLLRDVLLLFVPVCFWIGGYGLTLHLRHLAELANRIPDTKLGQDARKHSKNFLNMVSAATITGFVVHCLSIATPLFGLPLGGPGLASLPARILDLIVFLATLGALITLIQTRLHHKQLRNHLKQQLPLAEWLRRDPNADQPAPPPAPTGTT